jgi:hypothetical protein
MQHCVVKMPLYPLNWSQFVIYIYIRTLTQTHRDKDYEEQKT